MRILLLTCMVCMQVCAQNDITFPQTHFWISETTGEVIRSKVFGPGGVSEDRMLVNAAAQNLNVSNGIAARSILLDETNEKVYWCVYENSAPITSTIYRMNLDGSGMEIFLTVDGVVSGIQIDPAAGRLMWVEANVTNYFSRLMSITLEGTGETVHFDSNGATTDPLLADMPLFWDLAFDGERAWFIVRNPYQVDHRHAYFVYFDLESEQFFRGSFLEERNPYFYLEQYDEQLEVLFFSNVPTLAVEPHIPPPDSVRQRYFAISLSLDDLALGTQYYSLNVGSMGIFGLIGVVSELHITPGTVGAGSFPLENAYWVLNRLRLSPEAQEFGRIDQVGTINGDFNVHTLVAAQDHKIGTMIPHTENVIGFDTYFLVGDFQAKVSGDGYPEDIDEDGLPESASLALLSAAVKSNQEPVSTALQEGYVQNINLLAQESAVDELPVHREVLAALFLLGSEVRTALITFLHNQGITLTGDYATLTVADPSRAANEPLSGSGDLDGDGVSNLDEYLNTIDAGGTIEQFVQSALDDASAGGDLGGGGGGGGGCVIANVTEGTPLANELDTIRSFRDSALLTNPLGTALSKSYYLVSDWWLSRN